MNHQQFKAVREELRAKGGYLADPKLPGRLEWLEETKLCHHLVTCEAAEQYRQALDAKGESPLPPSAVLSAIVRLNTQGFYMTACTGWDPHAPPSNGPRKLADVKPSAWTTDPGIPALSGDFKAGWNNLAKLIKGYFPKSSRKFRKSSGTINWNGGKGDASYGFQIRHRLFEPKYREEEEEEKCDPRFLIENWPVQNPAAQSHLDALKDTHVVNPIPAYDVEGHLILPTEYESKLRGAIVRLEFQLVHWLVRRQDFFSANVERIRVLVPPYSDTPNATRKRLAQVDDFYDPYTAIPPTPIKRMKLKKEEGEEGQARLY
ncbi:hypothetical protein EST38_g6231 [Candolleomyces aberdarensis]|uniref:Uncharacterized protein n=1 Tax=Candolleomyces aberdarensis TaxID=2316362 RepID=A0A4V1Q3S8_9AGAR|nr:hypothetical protein EST38_g6231 [Candolleomyces aberdarensis]